MAEIYFNGDIHTEIEWAEITGIPVATIKERHKQGYAGEALFISPLRWRRIAALQPAVPKNDYERMVRKRIIVDIPQFRFDILVEVSQKVGMKVFNGCELKKQVNKSNWAYAVTDGGLLAFGGPNGTQRWDWMVQCADWVRRWQNPLERK